MAARIADRAIVTIHVISRAAIIIAIGMISTVIGASIYESFRTLLNRLIELRIRLFPAARRPSETWYSHLCLSIAISAQSMSYEKTGTVHRGILGIPSARS